MAAIMCCCDSSCRSLNALKSPLITACSISAPLKPSVCSASSSRSKLDILRPGCCSRDLPICIPKISARSSIVGNVTKKTSSNLPLRSSSGGNCRTSLAVAMTNTGAVLSFRLSYGLTDSVSSLQLSLETRLYHLPVG